MDIDSSFLILYIYIYILGYRARYCPIIPDWLGTNDPFNWLGF